MKLPRTLVIAFVALSMTLPVGAQIAPLATDEASVRALIEQELDGWAKYDAARIAACFTSDTTWQNPFGVRIHSRAILEKFLTGLFMRPGYRSAKETTAPHITDIHILSSTSAAVWSEEKSAGQVDDATGKPMAPRYSHYLEVLIKKDGAWLISDSIIMDEYPRP